MGLPRWTGVFCSAKEVKVAPEQRGPTEDPTATAAATTEPAPGPLREPVSGAVSGAVRDSVPGPLSEAVSGPLSEPVPAPLREAMPGALCEPACEPVSGPPGEAAVRDALGDWRQDAVLICLLPVLCWPALIGALVTRPAPLRAVLLGVLCLPVLVALRELYAAQRVRSLLRDPELRWTPYEAEVVRGRGLPPLLVLGGGSGGGIRVLSLGPLGRRVLPPAPAERFVWLAGDPVPGAVVWAPHARELGRARRPWRPGAADPRPAPRPGAAPGG